MDYIAFPKLGLRFEIGNGIQITENFSIKWYGIIICFAFILCFLLALRVCEKYDISKDNLLDYLLAALPSAIIGSRLYYVIFSWDSYKDDLFSILKIWEGGLAIYGGIIGVVISVFIMTRIKKESFLKILDFAMPYIILGQAIGRWGNFFNQEAYGDITSLPWGMTGSEIALEYGDQLVHPTFLYESLWCIAAFAVLMVLRRHTRMHGEMVAWYMILYGAERALVEGLRTDSLMWGSVRVSQVLSVVLVIAGIVFLIVRRSQYRSKLEEESVEEESSIAKIARELGESGDAALSENTEEKDDDEDTTEE